MPDRSHELDVRPLTPAGQLVFAERFGEVEPPRPVFADVADDRSSCLTWAIGVCDIPHTERAHPL